MQWYLRYTFRCNWFNGRARESCEYEFISKRSSLLFVCLIVLCWYFRRSARIISLEHLWLHVVGDIFFRRGFTREIKATIKFDGVFHRRFTSAKLLAQTISPLESRKYGTRQNFVPPWAMTLYTSHWPHTMGHSMSPCDPSHCAHPPPYPDPHIMGHSMSPYTTWSIALTPWLDTPWGHTLARPRTDFDPSFPPHRGQPQQPYKGTYIPQIFPFNLLLVFPFSALGTLIIVIYFFSVFLRPNH